MRSEDDALAHLAYATALNIEPMDYFAQRFRLGEALVMQRAAHWAGLQYFPAVPGGSFGSPVIEQLDRMGQVRSLRMVQDGQQTLYTAPRFASFLQLRLLSEERPDIAGRMAVVPASAIRSALAARSAGPMMEAARHRLFHRWPRAVGQLDAPRGARIGFVMLLAALLMMLTLAPWINAPVFLPIVGVLMMLPALLRIAAVLAPDRSAEPVRLLSDAELPVYTLLVPLRDESHMVAMLAEALRRLDYPAEKLDVLFVVEMRSLSTVSAVQAELHDPRFQLVLVPDAMPRTKPKALNYALPLVRGAHLAVYDAEDIPEPGQLRLAASTFRARPDVMCLQAELVIDNAGERPLAALFAGEYAGQFGLMLPLLARLRLPMPLGGTSNHFRVSALRQVGGWDSYNVTEDADLGMRLARLKLRTDTIASHTGEEAPIRLRAWLKQRTRWMKGWMQTLIVHDRDWRALLQDLGWPGFLVFHLYVGSMILSAPLHTAFLISFGAFVTTVKPTIGLSEGLALVAFGIGYLGPVLLAVAGLARLKRLDLLPAHLLLPVYWVLHSIAMVLAARELVLRPFAWSKTRHGETRMDRRRSRVRQPAQAE